MSTNKDDEAGRDQILRGIEMLVRHLDRVIAMEDKLKRGMPLIREDIDALWKGSDEAAEYDWGEDEDE
jgi:hypothetical protein